MILGCLLVLIVSTLCTFAQKELLSLPVSALVATRLAMLCSRTVCINMSGAVRVSQHVHPPGSAPYPPMPHSQSAFLVSRANYFTGACTLSGAVFFALFVCCHSHSFVYCKHACEGLLFRELLLFSWQNSTVIQ